LVLISGCLSKPSPKFPSKEWFNFSRPKSDLEVCNFKDGTPNVTTSFKRIPRKTCEIECSISLTFNCTGDFLFDPASEADSTPPKFNIAPEKWWLED